MGFVFSDVVGGEGLSHQVEETMVSTKQEIVNNGETTCLSSSFGGNVE